MSRAINQPNKIPMSPPSRLRNKDSTRNWSMISRLRAPTVARFVMDYEIRGSTGNLLVSARNTSTIYKVDRASGAILWRLGGKKSDFKMGAGTTFALQHDVRRHPDGSLTIFDDGQTPGTTSRAIVLNVDEVAMTASLIRSK